LAWLDRGVIAVARTQVARRGVRPHLGLEEPRVITIGIDPHKSSHTAVALDETGALLGELRVPADSSTLARLGTWAASWPQRVWAIEGASGLGRLLAQQLVASGETVVDVPAALAARTRVLQRGHGRKSDGIDARSVAVVAQHRDDLSRVAPDDHCAVLRLLSDRRDELTSERRRAVNRLHRLLRDLRPGGAPRQLSADRASRLLATIKPAGAVDIERKAMARQLIADVARIDRALIDNRRRCAEAVAASGSSLTEIFGISEVLAAKILGHTGDITRFANADRYASYAGTAPIEVSSGDQRRHRLSRAGNRSLNHALHLAARVQTMHPGPGRTHYARKQAEHKTPAEALRSLKRQLAKVVYRHLRDDHAHQTSPSPGLT
jgi:transposase